MIWHDAGYLMLVAVNLLNIIDKSAGRQRLFADIR
jgi:hypothetical protein